ncbi:MAG: energy transducer TonB [Nevskia sp.]|nr:energy transducer TonB [Nevskia sp.]
MSTSVMTVPGAVAYPTGRVPSPLSSFRWATALVLSGATSLGLFWLLYGIIHVTGHGVNKIETLPTVDFVRLKRDVPPEQMERRKPPPPPAAKQPPAPSKMQVEVENTASAGPAIAVPSSIPPPSVGGGISGGGASVSGMLDSDLVPLQRIPPQYPAEARRAGIGGKVKLTIHVLADGSVGGAKIIEANPKGMFEAASITAVRKFRFKPKIINGKPVEYDGTQTIEFDINKAD